MSSRWLKFSNRVVNAAHISHIDVTPERISIYINTARHDGSWLFGSGGLQSMNTEVYVDKKDSESSYKYVKDWIDKLPG